MARKRDGDTLPCEGMKAAHLIKKVHSQRFQGRRVLVTGGSMGIGESVASAFADEGAEVLIVDLVTPKERIANSSFLRCDCSIPEEIEQCCKAAGAVDILINNVCVQLEAPCHEHSLEDWNKTLAVGLTSYFLFSKHLLPHMLREGRGAIINMASVQGAQSQPRVPAYAAVKGGVLSLTRQLGVEYAAKGIRVNSVSPGSIDTPLMQSNLKRAGSSDDQIAAEYPMKRIGQPCEVANLVLFLASDEASFITAQDITVDGGITSLGRWAKVT